MQTYASTSRHTLNLYERSQGQLVHRESTARRRGARSLAVRSKEFYVNLVHGAIIRQILEKHSHLRHFVEGRARIEEHLFEICQGLPHFFGDIAVTRELSFR